MTVTPLSRLLALESDHTVCFDRHDREQDWHDFLHTVAGLAAALKQHEARYWAIETTDSFEYGSALFGCWCAGKTPVLAPTRMLVGEVEGVEFDGIIAASSTDAGGRSLVALDKVEAATLAEPIIPSTSDLVMFTSGSTGQPTKVHRNILNIEAELDVLESLFGDSIGAGRVYSTVSHRHVYGLLFRLLWPLVTGRAFASFNFEYPENLIGDVSAGNTLVTSPAILKRMSHLTEPTQTPWSVVFSSGGLLSEQAANDTQRLLGCCPAEILGSTETSGVAWRQQQDHGAAERWHTLPEVRVRQDDEGFLEVSSPFMGLSNWHRMGDRVRLETNRSFELLGRGDHIVKIEEKRVSLAEIEQYATALPSIADAAAAALDDGARQYVGLVVQLSDAGKSELDDRGRKRLSDSIRQSLRDKLDPVAVPRKYRYVDVVPVNRQGKRQPAVIEELFSQP